MRARISAEALCDGQPQCTGDRQGMTPKSAQTLPTVRAHQKCVICGAPVDTDAKECLGTMCANGYQMWRDLRSEDIVDGDRSAALSADCADPPALMLAEFSRRLHVFQLHQMGGGCLLLVG